MTNEHIAEHLNGLALECEKLSEHAESFRTEQELLSAAAYLYDKAQEIAANGPPCRHGDHAQQGTARQGK